MNKQLSEAIIIYNDLINNKLNKEDIVEFEIRLQNISFQLFNNFYTSLINKSIEVSNGKIDQSINVIKSTSNDKKSTIDNIRQNNYTNGVKTATHYYIKDKRFFTGSLDFNRNFIYKVSVSIESNTDEFNLNSEAFARLKNRLTFVFKNWNIDLTITKSVPLSLKEDLRKWKDLILPVKKVTDKTYLNFMNNINENDVHYEIELEYNKQIDILEEDVINMLLVINYTLNPELKNKTIMQENIYEIAKCIYNIDDKDEDSYILSKYKDEWWGLKRLLPQVIGLDKGNYKNIYPPTNYFLLDKADGIRSIVYIKYDLITKESILFLLEKKLLSFTTNAIINKDTIVDCELIYKNDKPEVYVFDVIKCENIDNTKFGYEQRILSLKNSVKLINEFKGITGYVKNMIQLTGKNKEELKPQFKSFISSTEYETDGLILTEPNIKYKDTKSYKWKSPENSTIDFLVKKSFNQNNTDTNHTIYNLFVGVTKEMFKNFRLTLGDHWDKYFPHLNIKDNYIPIPFKTSLNANSNIYYHPNDNKIDIDNKICEFKYINNNWILLKVRDDRNEDLKKGLLFGNDYKVAELLLTNILDPLLEEHLWLGYDFGYFSPFKNDIYASQTAFTSFVKSNRIKSVFNNFNWVIDLGVGKGQDLFRYIDAQVKNLIGFDKDHSALLELISRKYSLMNSNYSGSIALYAIPCDLTLPFDEVYQKTSKYINLPLNGVDGIVSNLALHYFCNNTENIRNLISICRKFLKSGGLVSFTIIIGEEIINLFNTNNIEFGNSWDKEEDGILKYSIVKKFKDNELTDVGQEIDILLPFSDGKYYSEYLINTEFLISEFIKREFKLISKTNFNMYFEKFEKCNPAKYANLKSHDFEFLKLYGELLFKFEKH